MIGHQRAPRQSSSTDSVELDPTGLSHDRGPGNAARTDRVRGTANGRDPSDFSDEDGNPTTHAPVGPDQAVHTPDATPPTVDPGEREVRPLHLEADPLELAGTPAAADLYESRASTGECTGEWIPVTGIVGSPEAPSRLLERDPTTIFIDDMPAIADIHQGSIGDCYFLSAVTGVAQSDPGHLRDMFTVSGDQVQVRLYSFDAATSAWTERRVSVDTSFLHSTDGAGGTEALLSSGFRMGDTPVTSSWYVAASPGDMMWLMEDAQYEFALWAPLLEKAYARFVERFGQYGGAHSADANGRTHADGTPKSGYEVIDGGWSGCCFGMLYGQAELSSSETSVQFDVDATDAELVADNLDLIANMLMVGGTDVPADQRAFMTLSAQAYDLTTRLSQQVDKVLALASVGRHPNFQRTLQYVQARCNAYTAAEDAGDETALEEAGNKVSEACTRFTEPGAWPILESDRDDGAYTDLRDMAQVVQNVGTDASDGRRLTYTHHAYPVLGVTLRGADGGALTLDATSLQARHGEIDADQSTVQLRNPHGTNEPDFDGAGPADGEDDGVFSLALSQVFRVFSLSEENLVQT